MGIQQTGGAPARSGVPEVRIFEEALRGSVFERLARAVRSVGEERINRNYTTTFWFPRWAEPSNVAEQAVKELTELVDPGSSCIGMEWWLGRLRYGEKLRLHFDRDMTLRKKTGQYVHPLQASVLYLNEFPHSPTVILGQVPGPDGKSRFPQRPRHRESVEAIANRYVVFPGNLRHGVLPTVKTPDSEDDVSRAVDHREAMRLTFLVNYWDRRPLPPLCFDYDGTIYPSLRD